MHQGLRKLANVEYGSSLINCGC
jgi:hypothetical protein